MKTLLIQEIAKTLSTRYIAPGKSDAILKYLCDKFLPHEAGIGFIAIDPMASTSRQIVIDMNYRHTDDEKEYAGHTMHKIIIMPSFMVGIDIEITGDNLNNVKKGLYRTFKMALLTALPRDEWYRGFQQKR